MKEIKTSKFRNTQSQRQTVIQLWFQTIPTEARTRLQAVKARRLFYIVYTWRL